MVEARPWIDRRAMQRLSDTGSFQVFESEDCLLCVTGVGPLAAAGATGWMIGRFPEIDGMLNFGCCGAPVTGFSPGEVLLIHRIEDYQSGREYIPDVLVSHPFRESSLQTWYRPVEISDAAEIPVDMEAAAIFDIARRSIPPHRMLFIKVVSDNYQPQLDRDMVKDWVSAAVAKIEDWLPAWPPKDNSLEILQDDELELRDQLALQWKLSVSQKHQLNPLILGLRRQVGGLAMLCQRFNEKEPLNKQQRNQWFRDLYHEFRH